MSFHKLIRFKFFFLVWHNSGHFEKEPWFCGWHLRLGVWLLVVVGMVVTRVRMEHLPVVSPGPGTRVLGGVVAEGEHVEGGGGGAVQHGGAPHTAPHPGVSLLAPGPVDGHNARPALTTLPYWLSGWENHRILSPVRAVSAVVELTLVLRVSTLSRLCMTLRLLRPAPSLIVRPGGAGRAGQAGVGHGGGVAVSSGESRPRPRHTRTLGWPLTHRETSGAEMEDELK